MFGAGFGGGLILGRVCVCVHYRYYCVLRKCGFWVQYGYIAKERKFFSMLILSADGRNALKYHLERLQDMRESIPYIVYHDVVDTADEEQIREGIPYNERTRRARMGLIGIHKQIRDVEAVIKNFLYALDDQEIISDMEVGTVLEHWDFAEPENPTNDPAL